MGFDYIRLNDEENHNSLCVVVRNFKSWHAKILITFAYAKCQPSWNAKRDSTWLDLTGTVPQLVARYTQGALAEGVLRSFSVFIWSRKRALISWGLIFWDFSYLSLGIYVVMENWLDVTQCVALAVVTNESEEGPCGVMDKLSLGFTGSLCMSLLKIGWFK